MDAGGRWLLIGNRHWHWAEAISGEVVPAQAQRLAPAAQSGALRCWDEPAASDPDPELWRGLRAWAAVGALPEDHGPPTGLQLGLERVPLRGLPPWLGVDRALVGWAAWRRQQRAGGGGVLAADAGTVLSLTRVDSSGSFAGGRLLPGAGLQLASMARGTALLPVAQLPDCLDNLPAWPSVTTEAMVKGCFEGLAAAVASAWREVAGEGPHGFWLAGGDAQRLLPLLVREGCPARLAPELALEALVELSSNPDQ